MRNSVFPLRLKGCLERSERGCGSCPKNIRPKDSRYVCDRLPRAWRRSNRSFYLEGRLLTRSIFRDEDGLHCLAQVIILDPVSNFAFQRTSSMNQLHVLVVDDEPAVRDILEDALIAGRI